MARNSKNVKIHIRLITAMVSKLMSENYAVSADHIGYPNGKPPTWNEEIPDIYAEKGNKKIFIEAETSDTLNTEETRKQWIALASNSNIKFSVIVPRKCLKEAKKLAKKWNVNVETFWSMDI